MTRLAMWNGYWYGGDKLVMQAPYSDDSPLTYQASLLVEDPEARPLGRVEGQARSGDRRKVNGLMAAPTLPKLVAVAEGRMARVMNPRTGQVVGGLKTRAQALEIVKVFG